MPSQVRQETLSFSIISGYFGKTRQAAVALLIVAFGLLLFQSGAGAQDTGSAVVTPATIDVEPATALTDGQDVTFTVTRPSADIFELTIFQCADTGEQNDCMAVANLGYHERGDEARRTANVWRVIDTPNGPVDCAVAGCVLRGFVFNYVTSQFDVVPVAVGTLTFDATAPMLPRPTLTVTAVEGLADGDIVTITGEGFEPFENLYVEQCSPNFVNFDFDDCHSSDRDSAEVDGTFKAELSVRRLLPSYRFAIGQLDCAIENCTVRVRMAGNHGEFDRTRRGPAPVAISFENTPVEIVQPLVTTQPRNGLVDNQTVTVRVSESEQYSYYQVLQCPTDTEELARCLTLNATETGRSDGFVTLEAAVRRIIRIGNVGHGGRADEGLPEPLDCASAPKVCTIVVIHHHEFTEVIQSARALSFDPSVPSARAVVKITKRNQIVPGGTKTIRVSNNPNQWIEVRQCPRSAVSHEEAGCTAIGRSHRARETLSIRTEPTRFLSLGRNATPIDCLQPKACDFRVFGSDGPIRRLLVNFVGDQTKVPSFTLATQRDLTHGQQVDATVDAPNAVWTFRQCVVAESERLHGNGNCVRVGATNVTGRHTPPNLSDVPVDVSVRVTRFVGTFDCSLEPRSCLLRLEVSGTPVAAKTLIFVPVEAGPTGLVGAKPTRDLVDGQQVTVTAQRSVPGYVSIVQCVKEATEFDIEGAACLYLGDARQRPDLNNKPTATVRVRRMLDGVDCAESAGRCVLRSTVAWPNFDDEFINLRFDDTEVATERSFTVRPRRDLVHGQSVTVGGINLGDVHYVEVAQCGVIDGDLADGSCSAVGWIENPGVNGFAAQDLPFESGALNSDLARQVELGPELEVVSADSSSDGLSQIEVVVRRYVGAYGADTTWDCASARNACVLRFRMYSINGMEDHEAGLSFDPDGPSPQDAELSVTPRRNLADGQEVRVSVTNSIPMQANVMQCARLSRTDVDESTCIYLGNLNETDVDGVAMRRVKVHRYLEASDGSGAAPVDCATVEVSCVMRVDLRDGFYGYDANTASTKMVAITFDPDAPAVPLAPTTLTISPDTALAAEAQVTVSGPSAESEAAILVIQCVRPPSGMPESCDSDHLVGPDFAGEPWQVEMTVVRQFGSERENQPVVCTETPCFVLALLYDETDGWVPFAQSEDLVFAS